MEGYFLYIANKIDAIRLGDGSGRFDLKREIQSLGLWRAVAAELLATMLFVLVGTMAAVSAEGDSSAKYVHIGLAFGLGIAIDIQMFGHISGAHMNPAVSVAMATAMKISAVRALLYVVAQCVGAILGAYILKGITPDSIHSNLGLTKLGATTDVGQGFGVELIFTFILVFTIFGITDSNRPFFGNQALGIGLTVALLHFAGIPFTGASMNPARSLGSAVASTYFDNLWIYWVAPIVGGIVAAMLYKFIFDPYRGQPSHGEAIEKIMERNDVLVIPNPNNKMMTQGNGEKHMYHTSHL